MLNNAETRIRPVHIQDVAQALSNILTGPDSTTLNLPGPAVHTYESLMDLVASITYNAPSFAPTIPKSVMMAVAKAAQLVWWPLISPDEVERRYINDVGTDAKGEKWLGDWDKVGVVPEEVENLAITFLRRYRTAYVSMEMFISSKRSRCSCNSTYLDNLHDTVRTTPGRWLFPRLAEVHL